MGDAADDAWDAAFEREGDRLALMLALSGNCPKPASHDCQCRLAEWNDDGLYECPCGEMVDL